MRASEGLYGLIGVGHQPSAGDALSRLRQSRATIFRATTAGVTPVYEGQGWIEAIDGAGSVWFAVRAVLHGEAGSDYTLLRSLDAGMRWEERGPIYARSVKHVLALSADSAWVHGAMSLFSTSTGGKEWVEVKAPGARIAHRETLRRDDSGAVLIVGGDAGALITRDGGTTFTPVPMPGTVHDFARGLFLLSVDGKASIAAANQAPAAFAEHRLPMRLVVEGDVRRVLSRGADPEKAPRMGIHRSEDGGKTWSRFERQLTPDCDIAGRDFGLGMDVAGGVHVATG
jgi:photosystem II stability/assembly factor-like uncharacterized protein